VEGQLEQVVDRNIEIDHENDNQRMIEGGKGGSKRDSWSIAKNKCQEKGKGIKRTKQV
jgi:hypothetical protein